MEIRREGEAVVLEPVVKREWPEGFFQAISNAQRFITALPRDLPYPGIGAMPDGDISLDWDFGPRRTLTVAIGSQSRLAYVAINTDEEWSGTFTFTGTVPKALHLAEDDLRRSRIRVLPLIKS